MADLSITTTLPDRNHATFRGAAPKWAQKTLKKIMCTTGFYEIYLNGCGQVMVRRITGAEYTPAFNAANVEHAIELAKSGELARLEAQSS